MNKERVDKDLLSFGSYDLTLGERLGPVLDWLERPEWSIN